MAHMRSSLSGLGLSPPLWVWCSWWRLRAAAAAAVRWAGSLMKGQFAGGNGLAVALAAMGHIELVAKLGSGGCAQDELGGGRGCHLLTQLAQLVAQGGH
eukprot:4006343-Pleurochrysis_carterae.AAC.1